MEKINPNKVEDGASLSEKQEAILLAKKEEGDWLDESQQIELQSLLDSIGIERN